MSKRVLNPPWKMWGESKIIDLYPTTPKPHEGPAVVPATGQVCRIDYGRPETWRFLLFARLLNVDAKSEAQSIQVFFDLTVGVGRAQSTLTDFEHYVFPFPTTNETIIWSTSVHGPVRDPDADDTTNLVELFPAEAIQVAARAKFYEFGDLGSAQVEVAAYFSPNMHMRPEWFLENFPGGEHETL